MKEWPDSHPKANAMRRKRAQILAAAETVFLKTGFSGSSMDDIAERANVSLMTLYRHAENKEELFAAVVAGGCTPSSAEELAKLESMMELALDEVLFQSAIHIQEVLTRPETIALIRVAIAEITNFPHLTELAHQGFVQHFQDISQWIIREKTEPGTYSDACINAVSRNFVNRISGGDILRMLLGHPPPSKIDIKTNARVARDEAMAALLKDSSDLES